MYVFSSSYLRLKAVEAAERQPDGVVVERQRATPRRRRRCNCPGRRPISASYIGCWKRKSNIGTRSGCRHPDGRQETLFARHHRVAPLTLKNYPKTRIAAAGLRPCRPLARWFSEAERHRPALAFPDILIHALARHVREGLEIGRIAEEEVIRGAADVAAVRAGGMEAEDVARGTTAGVPFSKHAF